MPGLKRYLSTGFLLAASLGSAQNVATLTETSQPTTMQTAPLDRKSASVSLISGSAVPTASDSAPGGGNGGDNNNSSGITNYYFGFLIVIFAAIALCLFICLRRRRMRMTRYERRQRLLHPHARASGGGSLPDRRRVWRWGEAGMGEDSGRVEGLNEDGEAPPPYLPKPTTNQQETNGHESAAGPAIPLQTLSREDAGLKPPDYSATFEQQNHSGRHPSTSEASTSASPTQGQRSST